MISTLLPAGVDLHALHRLDPERYPFLLQSTATTAVSGGFDVLLISSGEALVLDEQGKLSGPASETAPGFLAALDAWWQQDFSEDGPGELPFGGGWFLYLGYELAAEVEPSLSLSADPDLPAAFAVRCPAAIIRDHRSGDVQLVAEDASWVDPDRVLSDLGMSSSMQATTPYVQDLDIREEDPEQFLAAVRKAKHYIARGDIYQANLSRAWTASGAVPADPNRVYEKLCASNPGPFAGLFRWEKTTVVSSSPERLLHIRDGHVSTRPIAGTRPRSDDALQDMALLQELIANPKERAEHVMLIDLERNDLGRICEPGSVVVDEMMIVESYSHVHHIVSNVQGRLQSGITPGAAIRAVFPGGTITGCPKVRCMQIIHELEHSPRGAYTGSFGYLNRNGSMDLNILIRTIVMGENGISLRAGSGIVADSEPAAELDETRAKAKGLIRALVK